VGRQDIALACTKERLLSMVHFSGGFSGGTTSLQCQQCRASLRSRLPTHAAPAMQEREAIRALAGPALIGPFHPRAWDREHFTYLYTSTMKPNIQNDTFTRECGCAGGSGGHLCIAG
jgi:hypothetical protein